MSKPVLKKTCFTESLIRNNVTEEHGFKEWIFYPGMLFSAVDKWWGDRGKRSRPHEGLDLCLYRNLKDRIVRLGGGTQVPAMYDGVVVKIIDDFLGKSVLIEHRFPGQRPFCSIYGHTVPEQGIEAGSRVTEGDIIASISDTGSLKTDLFPHLHITIGQLYGEAYCEQLDWETIGRPEILTLLDPLAVVGGNYVIQTNDAYLQDR